MGRVSRNKSLKQNDNFKSHETILESPDNHLEQKYILTKAKNTTPRNIEMLLPERVQVEEVTDQDMHINSDIVSETT